MVHQHTRNGKHSFALFDIDSFYPSITESLLSKTISFAKNYTTINDKDIDIIMHRRKSLLFDNETTWSKKKHSSLFDVSFDVAEVCELIGLFLLNNLSEKYGKNNVGLYRDDGLVLLRNASGPQSERTRKDITREFKKEGLNISKPKFLNLNFWHKPKNLQLPRRHPKPHGRNPLSIQKAQQRNSLHRHQFQPSAYKNKTLTSSHRPTNLRHFVKS